MENLSVILKENGKLQLGPNDLQSLSDDHCRIKIHACGVCSSDIFRAFEAGAYHYPLVMGHEFAGKVIQVGQKNTRFNIGDRVAVFPLIPCKECKYCHQGKYNLCTDYDYFGSRRDGGYSKFIDVPFWNLLPLPEDVDFKKAAALEPLSVVIHALEKFNTINELLIIGGGFLGLLAIKVLKINNPDIKITLIDRNANKCEMAESFGAKSIFLPDEKTIREFVEKNDCSYGNILEASGAPINFSSSLKLASPGAKVVWLGNINGDLSLAKKEVSTILRKELQIMGTWNSNFPSDWEKAIKLDINLDDLPIFNTSLEDLPHTLSKLYQHKIGKDKFPCPKVMIWQ